ncbi:uncharacterized protein LOC126792679 [Argentina anserina]|uniref:uncharacterized protein LOC126792679 n=1 Tax=Argentina anserina TaxID=57926 RepID=UPI0021766F2E|nr:uncharacterized protein LOC126792679 [Potentilla anserina]
MAKSPISASDDVTVFVTTSLVTYLAITVSGNETISDLKRKLENEHKLSDGEIKIRSLKVNRRGCLYRLSDCMRVRSIASGVEKECFLFADASVIEKIGEIEHGPQNVGSSMQLIGSGICDNAVLSGADHPLDVLSKRLFGVDDSVPLLIGGNKNNIVDQNGSVDSGRETSKDMEIEIKHFDDDHLKASFDETNNGSVPETQEGGSLFHEGFRVPAAPEQKEVSEAKTSALLGEASPSAKKRRQAKRKSEEAVHLKGNDAPVHGIYEEQSQIEDSLNEGGDVACDTLVVNITTTEESRRDLASNNRSDSEINRTSDTHKESDTSGEHAKIRKDTSMNCNTAVEDPSQSQTQTASKKKCEFENITNSEDSLKENKVLNCDFNEESSQRDASESRTASKKKRKLEKVTDHLDSINENNVIICDSNKEAFQPEIASELSVGKTASTTLEGSLAKTSDMLTNSLDKMKKKKKKKELKPLDQVVDAAPSDSGDMEKRSMVASAGMNMEKSSGEDTCVPIQELQENRKAPSSLDNSTEEKAEGHPTLVVKAHGENGSSSAERVREKREPSQTNDSEAMLSENQGKTDGSNAELIVTSDLLNENEPVTASEKKTKKKKTKGSLGAELIIESQCDISLAEPHEAVHGEHDSGKAKTKESNLSQKKGKDISNKETEGGHIINKRDGSEVETSQQVGETPENAGSTKKKSRGKHDAVTRDKLEAEESCHIIMEADKCDGSELETSQQVGKSTKKKSKRKHDAMTQDPQKLEAEEKRASHMDPAQTTDKRDGNVVETLEQIGRLPEIAESTKKKSKKKHDDGTQHPQKLEVEEKNASHQHPALTIDSRMEALASKKKKSKLAKTIPIDQSNAKCLKSGTEYGVQNGTLRACPNSMSESNKFPSQQEHISAGTSLLPNLSGNHEEFSCEEENDFHKYMVPSQNKNKVGSGEMHVEEVTKSTKADSKLKSKKKCKAVDSSGCSRDLQSPRRSDKQGIGGKSEASISSSMQREGSISNVDGVVSQPQRSERIASKSGTKAQSSDASGKMNSIPKVAAKQSTNGSGVNSLTEKKNEAVAVSSLKREKSNNKEQNKPVKKYQSGVTQNVVASGKAPAKDDGEVLNNSKHKKSSAAQVAPEYRNGSSERKDGVVDSGASTTSSDYSLSSESDYSDEESNAGSCASSGKKGTGRSGYSSINGKPARRIKNDDIFLKSSVYKKVFEATKSQPEEDSEAPEFIPDSQPPAK